MKKTFKKMNYKVITVLFTLFQFITFPMMAFATEVGQDLTQSGLLDSFSVSNNEINDGEKIRLTVNFSEKDGLKIKNGDRLHLDLPSSGEVTLTGYTSALDLKNEVGQVFGRVNVNPDGINVVFNETAEYLENVRGSFSFEALGRNYSGNVGEENTAEISFNMGTTLENQLVRIHRGAAGTSSVFYYKTGDMQPEDTNHVRWFLSANPDQKMTKSGIEISDQIQNGQKLVLDSISISVSGESGNQQLSVQEFNESGMGNMNVGENEFEFSLYQNYSDYSANIFYLTVITDSSLKEFANHSQATYETYDGVDKATGESFNYSVENISVQGEATGELPAKGTIRVEKRVANTDILVTGVTFALFDANNEKIAENVTNESGIVEFSRLKAGNYVVKETKATEWLEIDTTKEFPVTINEHDEVGVVVPVENEKKTTTIKGVKKWQGGPEVKPTIELQLLRNGEIYLEAVTLENGTTEALWENVAKTDDYGNEYRYSVEEIDTHPNYEASQSEDGLTITNTFIPETINVTGKKEWVGGPAEKPTIQLQLLQNEENYGEAIKLENGEATYTWENLPKTNEEGKEFSYTVKEVEIPDNYKMSVSEDGLVITNTFVEPIEPLLPPEPMKPIVPAKPLKPVDPIDPIDPPEPEDPRDPKDPVDPVDPTEPEDPTDPKDPADPVDPVDPKAPTDPKETPAVEDEEKKEAHSNKSDANNKEKTTKMLPQTGENSSKVLLILGLAILLTIGTVMAKKRKI